MLVNEGRDIEETASTTVEKEYLTVIGQAPDTVNLRRCNLQKTVSSQCAVMSGVVIKC